MNKILEKELANIFRMGFDDELCNNEKKTFENKEEIDAYELGEYFAFNDISIQMSKYYKYLNNV